MLGQIANYCPVISGNTIIKNSTSVQNIWQVIRLHYGFQSTGAHFIDFSEIHLRPGECPEDLYQRLMAFAEDNLLQSDCGISHHGDAISADEELSPSLESFLVLTWLRLIHSGLPKLVKQRYGTELRSRTLTSIKPEISQALDSLLEEIHNADDAKAMHTVTSHAPLTRFPSTRSAYTPPTRSPYTQLRPKTHLSQHFSRSPKSCTICKQVGRNSYNHFLSECLYLPEQDKQFILKARQITGIIDNDTNGVVLLNESEETDDVNHNIDTTSSYRIQS